MKNFLTLTVNAFNPFPQNFFCETNLFSGTQQHSFTCSPNTLSFKTQKIRFFCTISSGQDSTATLFLLLHTNKKKSLQLLYCNHFWQIKNFFSARSLYQISYFSNLPYTFILPENRVLTENESREWRKKNFYRFSQVENLAFLVTGHTETDTVEKNLANVLRGTSPGTCSKNPILNYRKTVGSFFSSLDTNIIFLLNIETTKTASLSAFFLGNQVQNKTFLWVLWKPPKPKKNKRLLLIFPKKTKNMVLRAGTNCNWEVQTTSQFLKLGKNKIWNKKNKFFSTIKNWKKQPNIKFFFPKKERKLIIGPVYPTFYFFPSFPSPENKLVPQNFFCGKGLNAFSGDFVIKRKKGKSFSTENMTISYSFCLLNDFSNLKITSVKPLDRISRRTLSKFLNLYNLPLVSDIKNFSSVFSRNKIRHQLIPFSKSLVNPNLESLLINFFELLSDQNISNQILHQQLEFFYKILIFQTSPQKLSFLDAQNKRKGETFFSNEKKSVVQKFFFDYKNINLNFFQITKLATFY